MPPEQQNYSYQSPNQPPAPAYSIDYLNEISGPQKNTGGPSSIVMIIAMVVGLLALVGFAVFMFTRQPSAQQDALQLHQRLTTLQEVADDQQKHLKSSDLRTTNSSYLLFLANALQEYNEPLGNIGVDPEKVSKSQAAKESAYKTELEDKLEDARLNAVLDRTYARDMAYELSVVRSMMNTLYGKTRSNSTKEFLQASDGNLTPIAKDFSEFSAAES